MAKTVFKQSPFLVRALLPPSNADPGRYPFGLPIIAGGFDLALTSAVTFFVGENGSGKSTVLEGLAASVGFNPHGGSRDHVVSGSDEGQSLAAALKLTWTQKVSHGFFHRAETFHNFASYLEEVHSDFRSYGGRNLHHQSHGEAFLALFQNRFGRGIYLLDEPEAALSPQRQLSFLTVLHQLTAVKTAQFIIATHSPILLAFPGATILNFEGNRIAPIGYRETEHYRLTKDFLEAPEKFLRHLLRDEGDGGDPTPAAN